MPRSATAIISQEASPGNAILLVSRFRTEIALILKAKLGGDPEGMAHPVVAKQGLKPEDDGYSEAVEEIAAGLKEQCDAEADEVRELGGLFICGTERHESRRIDNQLRGRSGRQGDPGASRFFLSAEDDVIRLFAGDRIYKILDRLGPTDDEGGGLPPRL